MDNKRRLQIAAQANPSLRVAAAPPQQLPSINIQTVAPQQPNLTVANHPVNQPTLVNSDGTPFKYTAADAAAAQREQQQATAQQKNKQGFLSRVANFGKNLAIGIVKAPIQFSEDYSNTFANLGNRAAGGKNQTIQQNMGGDPVSDKVLSFSGATGKNKQLATSFGETALNFAPGAEGFGIGKNIAEQGAKSLLLNGGRAAAEGAAFGAAGTGLQQVDEGKFNGKDLLEGAGTGALFGLGGAAAGAGFKAINNKFRPNAATQTIDPDLVNYLKTEKDPTAVHDLLSGLTGGGSSEQLMQASQKIAGTGSKKAIINALLDLPQEAAGGTVAAALLREAAHGGEQATENELQRQGANAAPNNNPNGYPIDLQTGLPTAELDLGNIAEGSVPDGTPGSVPAPDTGIPISQLSKDAKNSLENDPTGEKPGGIDRAAGEIDNGTAQPVRYRYTPEGDLVIEDGRHRVEAARQNGVDDFPSVDVSHLYGDDSTAATAADDAAEAAKPADPATVQEAVTKMQSGAPLTAEDLQTIDQSLSGTSEAPASTAGTTDTAPADASSTTAGQTDPTGTTTAETPLHDAVAQKAVSAAATFTPEERAHLIDSGVNPDEAAPVPATQATAGFAQSVRDSAGFSDPTKEGVSASYNAITNQESQDAAVDLLNSGIDNARNEVANALSKPDGQITAQDVANGIALAKYYDNLGGDANFNDASDILDRLANHLSSAGQTIQAASLLDNLSPAGLLYRAQKTLNNVDPKIMQNPDVRARLNDALDGVRGTPPGTEAHTYAVQAFRKAVSDEIPSTVGEKAVAIWKAGLLTGLRTQTGNILSNGTFGVLHELSNPGAVLLDKLVSTVTGERSKALTARGQIEGIKDGVVKAGKFIKTGVDERDELSNKLQTGEINFKNPVVNGYVNGIFRVMGAADRPFYYRQLTNSFYDLAKADGLTKGLSGQALRDHVTDFIQNADTDTFNKVMNTATEEAQKSVLANDTFLGKLAGKANKAADEIDNPLGRAITKAAVNVAIPFSKVPSAFITRVFDFTPYGAVKTAVGQMAKGELNQRALVTAISEAGTGTALVFMGQQLAQNNLLSGQYPDDPHEQARWKAEGITPNSIKVGNKWLSLNYFGPVGSLFNMGKRITDTQKEGGSFSDIASNLTGGTVQDALGQSFLQGVSGILDAVNDPKRYAKSFVNSEVGSLVPTISNDIATATDSVQRQTNSPLDAVTNRIPVLRENNLAAVDSFGNTVTARTDPGNSLANPFRPSDAHSTALTNEIDRLHNIDPNNTDYQVTPEAIDKKLSVAGTSTTLTPQQRTALQQSAGHASQLAMTAVMNSDAYKVASDDEKAKMLKDASTDAVSVAKDDFEQKNKLGQYADGYSGKKTNLTAAQQSIAKGDIDSYVTHVANKQNGLDDTTAKLDDNSKAYYTRTSGMSAQDLQKYLASPADDNAKSVADQLNKSLPNGLQITASNQIAKDYAEYQKAKASGNWDKLTAEQKQDTFYGTVVKDNKSDLTQALYAAGGSHAQHYIDEGYVGKSDLDDAIDLDNQLYSAGLESSLKFSKTFRKTYGYGVPSAPSKDTSKTSSASSSKNAAAKEVSTDPNAIKLHFTPGQDGGSSSISSAKTSISAPSSPSAAPVVVTGVPSARTSAASASFANRAANNSKPQAIKLR